MSRLSDAKAEWVLALPPIAMSELQEPTQEFLRALAEGAGAPPAAVVKLLLDRAARRAEEVPLSAGVDRGTCDGSGAREVRCDHGDNDDEPRVGGRSRGNGGLAGDAGRHGVEDGTVGSGLRPAVRAPAGEDPNPKL